MGSIVLEARERRQRIERDRLHRQARANLGKLIDDMQRAIQASRRQQERMESLMEIAEDILRDPILDDDIAEALAGLRMD